MLVPKFLGGDGEAYFAYSFIKQGFKLSTLIYFSAGVKRYGADTFPKAGEPTVLCFNHSNGLTDAMVVIRSCPRMVRFVAKAALWNMPVIGQLVANAGAVPLQRKEDKHPEGQEGEKRGMALAETFQAITDALQRGECIGVAPEANSKARTLLDRPLKPGAALWALEAVFQNLAEEQPFAVKVVPCGLVYMHRGFWRSEAMVRYGEPILVDQKLLREHGVTPSMENPRAPARQNCVEAITSRLEEGLSKVALVVAPSKPPADKSQSLEGDWVALRNGIVAGRLVCQGDTASLLPLASWADLIKHFAQELERERNQKLAERVGSYHSALKGLGLHDSQLREASASSATPTSGVVSRFLASSLLCVFFLLLALPGALLWSPVWALGRCSTGRILKKGLLRTKAGSVERRRRNFDMIAEGNMTFGFVLLSLECIGTATLLGSGWQRATSGSAGQGVVAGLLIIPGLVWIMSPICAAGNTQLLLAVECVAVATVLGTRECACAALVQGLFAGIFALPALLWLTVRLVEEAAASARAALRARALKAAAEAPPREGAQRRTEGQAPLVEGSSESEAPRSPLDSLIQQRREIGEALKSLLPPAPPPLRYSEEQEGSCSWLWRRRKRDWHESVALDEDLDFLPLHAKAR